MPVAKKRKTTKPKAKMKLKKSTKPKAKKSTKPKAKKSTKPKAKKSTKPKTKPVKKILATEQLKTTSNVTSDAHVYKYQTQTHVVKKLGPNGQFTGQVLQTVLQDRNGERRGHFKFNKPGMTIQKQIEYTNSNNVKNQMNNFMKQVQLYKVSH
jgi:hypothetical protein